MGTQQDVKGQEIQGRWEATRPYHVGCWDSGSYRCVSVSQNVASPCGPCPALCHSEVTRTSPLLLLRPKETAKLLSGRNYKHKDKLFSPFTQGPRYGQRARRNGMFRATKKVFPNEFRNNHDFAAQESRYRMTHSVLQGIVLLCA